MADAESPGNLAEGLASFTTRFSLCHLILGKLRTPSEPDTSRLRPLPAFASPRQDHAPLKFSERCQHRKDQLPMRARGINHRISERTEASTGFAYSVQGIEQITNAAS